MLPGLAASVPVSILQEWTTRPVKPDITFQQFMRAAQFADELTWINAIAKVSQYQHDNPRCATFPPDMCIKITGEFSMFALSPVRLDCSSQ